MSTPAFPSHIEAALDRFTVPPLPAGFTDRLLARLDAGDVPHETAALPTPPPAARRNTASAWRRSGRVVMAVAALGIASATAAASGFFGKPLYVPVVSETLAKAKLVELPRRDVAKPKPELVTASAEPVEPPPAMQSIDPAKGRQAVRDLYLRLRADPEFRRLPPLERLAAVRSELQAMQQRGEVSEAELRAAVADFRERQRQMREKRLQAAQQRNLPIAVPPRERPIAERLTQRPAVDPARAEARREAYREMPAEQRVRLRELREQLRTASPAERPAIRREIRAIRQSNQRAAEEIDDVGKGNPDPVR